MNIRTPIALLVLLFVAVGCTSIKVTSERDPGYRFSTLQTWQWSEPSAEFLRTNEVFRSADINNAIGYEMARRGLRQVPGTTGADLQVCCYALLKEEHEFTAPVGSDEPAFSGGLVYNPKRGGWSYETLPPDLTVYTTESIALTVQLFDVKTGNRIWTGSLQTSIDRSLPKEKLRKRINAAANKLMTAFPLVPQ